jgi:predicted transcriptional regulator
MFLKRNA